MTNVREAGICEECHDEDHETCRRNGGWLSDYNEDGQCVCHMLADHRPILDPEE